MVWVRLLHRWIGLLLALVIVAVAASGGLLLFRDAYYRALHPDFGSRVTDAQLGRRADVLGTIERRWSAEGISLVKFPRDRMNVYQVWLTNGTEAFVGASDGEVLDQWHWSERVPAFLFELHAHLLREPEGTVANGITALALIFMALTGILLWWPARRTAYRLRGVIPRDIRRGGLLRSHAAAGMLAVVPVAVFAATGAGVVFYDQLSGIVTPLLDARPPEEPTAEVARREAAHRPWSELLTQLDRTFPDGQVVFYYPGSSENARMMFRKRRPEEWHPNGRTYVLLDPYTAEVVQSIDAQAQGAGTRFMHALYPVHAAKVGGLPMVALGALSAAALVWLGASGVWAYVSARVRRRTTS